jgi:hypothetical protein
LSSTIKAIAASALLMGAVHLYAADGPNSLIGVVTEAATSPKLVGAQITFTGLTGSQTTMVWPDGVDSKLTKIFDNGNLVIVQMVGGVGSTETAYLDKKNKRFTVVSVGAFHIPVDKESVTVGVYRGTLK